MSTTNVIDFAEFLKDKFGGKFNEEYMLDIASRLISPKQTTVIFESKRNISDLEIRESIQEFFGHYKEELTDSFKLKKGYTLNVSNSYSGIFLTLVD